jgi:S-adenosylmethionine:tRNA ribosyltransferase-isomerase
LVLDRKTGKIEQQVFTDIVAYLQAGDVLVLNDTRVIPARLYGRRKDTGGKIEVVLLKRLSANEWEVLVKPGKRAKIGSRIVFGDGELEAEVTERTEAGGRFLKFSYEGVFEELLDKLGLMPLPPYIKERLEDKERYQTVYSRTEGSSAAPTAGLHFTPELLSSIEQKGIELAYLLLHVGLGTFRPVAADNVEEHVMHSEYYEVSRETAEKINNARSRGGRVIAVGTTSVRTLETASAENGMIVPGRGWTDIFIYPGYSYKAVDALVTNFHLPKSTLLMLVSAFAGTDKVKEAYRVAVEERYRFFSFGDAMLIV